MVEDVMTLAEVAEKYKKDNSNLRKKLLRKIKAGKIIEGVDARLAGNTWLISKKAIRRLLK